MDCVVFVAVMCYVQDRLIHCLPVETTAPQFPYTTLSITIFTPSVALFDINCLHKIVAQ